MDKYQAAVLPSAEPAEPTWWQSEGRVRFESDVADEETIKPWPQMSPLVQEAWLGLEAAIIEADYKARGVKGEHDKIRTDASREAEEALMRVPYGASIEGGTAPAKDVIAACIMAVRRTAAGAEGDE